MFDGPQPHARGPGFAAWTRHSIDGDLESSYQPSSTRRVDPEFGLFNVTPAGAPLAITRPRPSAFVRFTPGPPFDTQPQNHLW